MFTVAPWRTEGAPDGGRTAGCLGLSELEFATELLVSELVTNVFDESGQGLLLVAEQVRPRADGCRGRAAAEVRSVAARVSSR